jgi:hypothetical protein
MVVHNKVSSADLRWKGAGSLGSFLGSKGTRVSGLGSAFFSVDFGGGDIGLFADAGSGTTLLGAGLDCFANRDFSRVPFLSGCGGVSLRNTDPTNTACFSALGRFVAGDIDFLPLSDFNGFASWMGLGAEVFS